MDYAFLGGGNMGFALAAALIRQRIAESGQVLVVDPAHDARQRAAQLGCTTASPGDRKAEAQIAASDLIVLAVKPQVAAEALAPLKGQLKPTAVVVSIMAGVRIAAIAAALEHRAIIRVMPNTPAQVGRGMSVYYAAAEVTAGQQAAVEALLKASGEALQVGGEDLIDAATAVSASGTAYVYYVAEHWIRAAQTLGFSETEAALLVRQTLLGAAALWESLGIAPAVLREQVTSKGGTTAAALNAFRSGAVGAGFETGIQRAYERAKELGR